MYLHFVPKGKVPFFAIYCPSLILAMQLQNPKSLPTELSIPNKFGYLVGFRGGFVFSKNN